VSAYIAHYIFQSYETYISRKVILPADDTQKFREAMPKDVLHNLYNDVINLDPCNKYNTINKIKINQLK
jgi:hypothetical protein